MKAETRYWVAVASKDHVGRGVAGAFMQTNHGKEGPLKRLAVNDWVLFYSPKDTYGGTKPSQAFTAIGQVSDDQLYQGIMAEGFSPYRRNVNFYKAEHAPIAPLLDDLDFIENKKSWGFKFRFGFFEIGEKDFKLISSAMLNGQVILIK